MNNEQISFFTAAMHLFLDKIKLFIQARVHPRFPTRVCINMKELLRQITILIMRLDYQQI